MFKKDPNGTKRVEKDIGIHKIQIIWNGFAKSLNFDINILPEKSLPYLITEFLRLNIAKEKKIFLERVVPRK